MKTIAQRHAEWEQAVMPRYASVTQKREMKRAFYSGFQACLTAGLEMADESGPSNDVGVTMIAKLHAESQAFGRDIAEGRA